MVRSSVREDILQKPGLGEDGFDNFTADIGQTKIAALRAISQLFVIDTQEAEHGRVQIMDMDRVINSIVTQFVGPAISHAAFDARTSHPDGEAFDMVIATIALRHGGPAKFTSPNDQRIFQHAARLEVLEQSSGAPVNQTGGGGDSIFDAAVMIPSAMVKLYEAHTAFCQTPSQQTVGR